MASKKARELVLIDLALSAGAGLGKAAAQLSLEAVADWAEHFSGTVDKALRTNTWKEGVNRRAAKMVARKMGKNAANKVRLATAARKPLGKALAQSARRDIANDPLCPSAMAAGKWCDPR